MSELYADSAVHLSPHVSWRESIRCGWPGYAVDGTAQSADVPNFRRS